jgi:hypothetical protein
MVRLQSSHDHRCIFWRVPAEAPTNHARRMALAVYDEPFTAFFTPHFKESSLFHAANNTGAGYCSAVPCTAHPPMQDNPEQ